MSTRTLKKWTYPLGFRYLPKPATFGTDYVGTDIWMPLGLDESKVLRFKYLNDFPASGATPFWSISGVQGHATEEVLNGLSQSQEPIGITVSYNATFSADFKTTEWSGNPDSYRPGWYNASKSSSPFIGNVAYLPAGNIDMQIPLYTLIDQSPDDSAYIHEAYPVAPAANMWFWLYQKILQSGVGKNLYFARQVKRLTTGHFEWGGGGTCFVAANTDGRCAQLLSQHYDGQAAIGNYGANGSTKNMYLAIPVQPIYSPNSLVSPLFDYMREGFTQMQKYVEDAVEPLDDDIADLADEIVDLKDKNAAIAKRAITL